MKISQKLFLAFVGLTSIVLIATLSLARWSFDQGFLDYINGLEQERLRHLSDDLLTLYADSNGSQIDNSAENEHQSTLVWQSINQKLLIQTIAQHSPFPRNNRPEDGEHRPPRPANNRPPMGPESRLDPSRFCLLPANDDRLIPWTDNIILYYIVFGIYALYSFD